VPGLTRAGAYVGALSYYEPAEVRYPNGWLGIPSRLPELRRPKQARIQDTPRRGKVNHRNDDS